MPGTWERRLTGCEAAFDIVGEMAIIVSYYATVLHNEGHIRSHHAQYHA
jgi:hypothetical protein